MRSPLIQTAAQAFMDKLVGDWGVAGTFQNRHGDGTILGEAKFVRGKSLGGQIIGEETLVHTPTQRAAAHELHIMTNLSEAGNGLAGIRIYNGLSESIRLSFVAATGLRGAVIHKPQAILRHFKIATNLGAPDHFEMAIDTLDLNGLTQNSQRLIYNRIKPGPVQK